MAPIPRLKPYSGPAILSYGFRPFFLFGALYSGLAVLTWLPIFMGDLQVASAFAPLDWHVHEMIYGYVPAVATGFLFTAIPNWTGRLPIQGRPLLVLLLVWVAGRVAVTTSAFIGWQTAAAIDALFLLLVMAATAREIAAGRNWRNLKVVVLVGVLAAGNIAFHIEAHLRGRPEFTTRIGLAVILMMIMLIGGRIVPSFTRNWLARENPGRMPAPFGRFDVLCVAAAAISLLSWIVMPAATYTGVLLAATGIIHLVRLARWAGDRAWRDRLVLVLHAGYAFVPLGFLLGACAAFAVISPAAGIHAWGAGAVGVMTLAVMTRASLGHTGHALAASLPTQAIYAAVIVAAAARIAAALAPALMMPLLAVAAAAWCAAFLGFAANYGPALMRSRTIANRC